jgi:hypothetical protein
MTDGIKKGKFVYKNQDSLNKMHEFYDKTLTALRVPYFEDYFETSFGQTHCLLVGDKDKPRICTIHGGNGITTLNPNSFYRCSKTSAFLHPMLSECRGRVLLTEISAAGKTNTGFGLMKF